MVNKKNLTILISIISLVALLIYVFLYSDRTRFAKEADKEITIDKPIVITPEKRQEIENKIKAKKENLEDIYSDGGFYKFDSKPEKNPGKINPTSYETDHLNAKQLKALGDKVKIEGGININEVPATTNEGIIIPPDNKDHDLKKPRPKLRLQGRPEKK